jgi:hypothetical protein
MASFAQASDINLKSFTCSGSVEYGKIIINSVVVNQNAVSITFTKDTQETQNYILTERFKNGSTDAHSAAYFIGATKSGAKNDYDDMALPHLGLYKDGKIGSEISFTIKGLRVFGTVNCK